MLLPDDVALGGHANQFRWVHDMITLDERRVEQVDPGGDPTTKGNFHGKAAGGVICNTRSQNCLAPVIACILTMDRSFFSSVPMCPRPATRFGMRGSLVSVPDRSVGHCARSGTPPRATFARYSRPVEYGLAPDV